MPHRIRAAPASLAVTPVCYPPTRTERRGCCTSALRQRQAPAYLAHQQVPSLDRQCFCPVTPGGSVVCSQDHSRLSATIHRCIRPGQPEALPRHPAAVR